MTFDKAIKSAEIAHQELPKSVQQLYEKSPDGLVYGVNEETYLQLKNDFPAFFKDYIENTYIEDPTKTAMIKYMQTGEGTCFQLSLEMPVGKICQQLKTLKSATLYGRWLI